MHSKNVLGYFEITHVDSRKIKQDYFTFHPFKDADRFWNYITKRIWKRFLSMMVKAIDKIAEIFKTYPSQADNITVQMVRLT